MTAAKGGFQRRSNCKGPFGPPCAVTPKGHGRRIGVKGIGLQPMVLSSELCRKQSHFTGGACRRPNAEKTRTRKGQKTKLKMLRTQDLSSKELIELVGNRFEHIPTRSQCSTYAVFSTIQ